MAKDPVCGVIVDEKTAIFRSLYESNIYYFDSEKCKVEFDRNPREYSGRMGVKRHTSHYSGYCPTPGCTKPQKGAAWYLYIGMLILLISALFLFLFARFLVS